MSRPRLLDLFCGAGGAAMGYHRAGFEVVGVDIEPQPDYPFEFRQADAFTILLNLFPGDGFDAIHASPPCKGETSLAVLHDIDYERLLVPTLERLVGQSLPWIVENVDNATAPPSIHKIRLCGSSFGLAVRRHRWFWSNILFFGLPCNHRAQGQPLGVYGHGGGRQMTRGRKATRSEAPGAMDIDWMTHRGITQAIPPAYTQFLGEQLLQHLRVGV